MNEQGQTAREAELVRRMEALGVSEEDIQETFVRSGGRGGQNVNKTSTCVMLLHKPSGLRVKCQTARHQGLNRELGRRLLLDKLEAQRRKFADAQIALAEKQRRQKRPRPRKVKARILAGKSRQSAKKALRRRSGLDAD